MFKVNNVFIVNFEHISHLFSRVSIIDFEQVNVSCVKIKLMDGKIRVCSKTFFRVFRWGR